MTENVHAKRPLVGPDYSVVRDNVHRRILRRRTILTIKGRRCHDLTGIRGCVFPGNYTKTHAGEILSTGTVGWLHFVSPKPGLDVTRNDYGSIYTSVLRADAAALPYSTDVQDSGLLSHVLREGLDRRNRKRRTSSIRRSR